ncbi:MAG TPA: hypothetical protein VMR37_03130 [Rhabdochlamydiaceae bacterium]|nr:hypothetical protein [Rhabdochlamydiaceae bacterium]
MKYFIAFLFAFAETLAFDPIDHYKGYVPNFNLSLQDFCEDAIEKSSAFIQSDVNSDYWCGYRDAFRIMSYKIED